jgi:formamidopyrimidine-DNA glycosylase
MPELPEVETVRRTLAPAIGAKIVSAWDSGKPLHMQRRPPRKRVSELIGAHVTGIRRLGKYLLVDSDTPRTLVVHLGMTGRFLIVAHGVVRAKHTHLVLELEDGRSLRFVDARRFGQIDVIDRVREHRYEALAALGPDALDDDIDVEALWTRAKHTNTSLKAFVLDQRVLAGVGNIYASEALWRARLRPTTRTRRLTKDGATRLAKAIREVLEHALEHGGTSLRDFVDAGGAAGENADYLWVYGRAGEPCLRCRNAIRRAVHQGRATYFCPTCQTP